MNAVTPQSADPTQRELARRQRQRRQQRRTGQAILVPVLLSLLYYLLIASPQYRSEMEFTIQGTHKAGPDLLGGLGIASVVSGSPAGSDARLVVDYVRSAEMVDLLRRQFGFNEAYGGFSLDPFSRLSADAPRERAAAFWRDQLKIDYDLSANVVDVRVSAYRPADAKRLADGVLAGANAVIQSLDRNAQSAAVKFASSQLAEQKRAYDDVRHRVTSVRGAQAMTLDAQATQAVQSITQIDAELARLRVEQATAAATYQQGAPQTRAVEAQIGALQTARAQAISRAQQGPGPGAANSDMTARTALLDYEFAQKSYYGALQAYQAAVNQSDGNHRYIVAFIPPRLPEQSNYFSRLGNVLAVAIASAILIGTGMLAYSIIKDHMQ